MYEVSYGIVGIVYRPILGAKKGGCKGFTKGIGVGIAGAITSPITGSLRITESLSEGFSGTITIFNNLGKPLIEQLDPKYVSVRQCRRIDMKGCIKPYDENMAIVNFYLMRMKSG